MTFILDLQKYSGRTGRTVCSVLVFVAAFSACREDVTDTPPRDLPGTTWEFDDFYITFVSESDLKIHGADPDAIIAEGVYSKVEEFIEIELNERVRAGSWDGERLIVDGMVGQLTATPDER